MGENNARGVIRLVTHFLYEEISWTTAANSRSVKYGENVSAAVSA